MAVTPGDWPLIPGATARPSLQTIAVNLTPAKIDSAEGTVVAQLTKLTKGSTFAFGPMTGLYSFVRTGDTTGEFRLARKASALDETEVSYTETLDTAAADRRVVSGKAKLAVVPPQLPALPLAAGAKVAFLGDSFVQRSGYSRFQNANPNNPAGVIMAGRGQSSLTQGALPRARIEFFINKDRPGSGESVPGAIGTDKMDGAIHGVGGDRLVYSSNFRQGFFNRADWMIQHGPAIVVIETPGGNDLRDGSPSDIVISRLDALLTKIRNAGIWAVVITCPNFIDASSNDSIRANAVAVNEWLLAQQTAGRSGLKVVDTRAVEGPGVSDLIQLLDGVHRGPVGSIRVNKLLLPVLQGMISAGNWRNVNPLDASNVFPTPGTPGTGGTRTVAAGNVADLTGNVATGMTVHRALGTSLVACSKEVVAAGNEKQVITITPVNDGTAIHEVRYRINTAATYPLPGSFGITDMALFDGIEMQVPYDCDDWAGWDINEAGGTSPVSLIVSSPSSILTQAGGSAPKGSPGILTCFWEWTDSSYLPAGINLGGGNATFVAARFLSAAAGTGTIKFGAPIFKPVAKADNPRKAWNM